MFFVVFNNANFSFNIKKLTWRFYIIANALLTTNLVKFIYKREFTKAAPDQNSETFMIYMIALKAEILIYLSKIA